MHTLNERLKLVIQSTEYSNRDEHNCIHSNGDPFAGRFTLFLLTKRPKAKSNEINQIQLIHEGYRTCYIVERLNEHSLEDCLGEAESYSYIHICAVE
jgi:hypothetical protein